MREIKFRGYAVEEMVYDQWMYGFGVCPLEFAEHYAKEIGRKRDWFLYTESGDYRVFEKSIGQYTGLKDSKGNDIYEGDIVKGHRWSKGEGFRHIGIVTYVMNAFKVRGVKRYIGRDTELDPSYEVIGNIYENPELISN